MKIIIRPATAGDLPQILKLNLDLFKFESQFDQTYNQNWTYSEIGQNYFKKRIEEGIVLVAETDHQIIGYLCGHSDTYSFRSLNPIFEIENMVISEKFQRQGIGTALINKLSDILKEKNIKRIRVGAIFENKGAISFYKKLGLIEQELFLERSL